MSDDAAAVVLGSIESESLSPDEVRFLKDENPAGITLFTRNISQEYPEQLPKFIESMQKISCQSSGLPLVIAIDQEGGRVRRIKAPFINQGPADNLARGKTDAPALAEIEEYGFMLGSSLKSLGVNVNFAPVLDVLTSSDNPSIGDRAFASTPRDVTLRAGSFLAGQARAGIIGCLKHFPGQGGAHTDTHEARSLVNRSEALIWESDLVPFKELLPRCPLVMISHCIYPELDDKEASLSKAIIKDLLKDQLAYQGIVISDDMTMGAITTIDRSWTELLIESISCGTDLILVCRGLDAWQNSLDAIRSKANSCSTFRLRLKDAASKINHFRANISLSSRSYI